MNLQLKFNSDGTVQNLTFILGTRKGLKMGILRNPSSVNTSDSLEDAPQLSFDVYKYDNGAIMPLWNDLTTFKLVYVPEFDTWFEAVVEENESDNGTVKHVSLTRLGESELTQIRVYGLNINTEDSIIYDENFKPTVLYDPSDAAHSLLNRVLSYAPHYSVGYVAPTVRNIQRTFSFNDQPVLDCFKNIAEEESLFFIYDSSDNNGVINRTVSVYDVMSNCNVCNYRGLFTHTCPKCGSTNVVEGYGEDTTILISSESLGNDLSTSTNTDAIANCYHLQAGDDIMTAAVRQCNPNGTGYIWNFTNEMYNEMSSELRTAIQNYNVLYNQYMTTHSYLASAPTAYNTLITKYKAIDPTLDIDTITNIIGYPALIKAWYDALDFYYFLKTSLMPSVNTDSITAQDVVDDIYTAMNHSTVAVGNIDNLSLAAASTAVMNNARLIANTIYEITVQTQTLTGTTWTGTLMATNFYDKDDAAVTQMMTVTVNADLEEYVSGKVMKTLFNTTQGESTVVAMYNQTLAQVQQALHYYSLDELNNINKSFNGAIEILSKFKADKTSSELYNIIYVPTKAKLDAVQSELVVRENEVNLVSSFVDTLFNTYITGTQTALNFENYLGSTLWVELNSFRREANFSDNNYVSTTFRRKFSYTDSNFISDSLTNSEIVQRAYEFLVQAEQKMAENNKYSYQISSSLKNLLIIPDFAKLRNMFKCGNWMRVKAKDGELYKLRLISYDMNFDNPESLTVNFSDVTDTSNVRAAQQIIAQSVDLVKNQKKYANQVTNKFTGITDDIQCDYVVNDSFVGGGVGDNIEILGDQMVTEFNVLDGLIQGKISTSQAMSLIQQELNKITLLVNNGEYILVTPVGDEDPSEEEWYERSIDYDYGHIYPEGDENPQSEGWYELVNNVYVLTSDTSVVEGKDYYERVARYVYTLTQDTTVNPYKDYYEYESGESSITIEYDGIAMTTSGQITLGGDVVFISNLTDGRTIISGDNITTGEIKSANYEFTSGNIFSDSGTLLSLLNGEIRTPGFYVNEDGDAWFKGIINAEGGFIGDTEIEPNSDSGMTLNHAHHAWKLRSAAVGEDDSSRYYAYLTGNKNLIVSNHEDQGHTSENDVTDLCSIGSYKYPWGKGYFDLLRVKHHNVLPEGLALTLDAGSWTQHASGYYTQTIEVNGMSGNVYLYIATSNGTDLDLVYKHHIEVDTINDDEVIFLAETEPASDVNLVLLVEDFIFSSMEEIELNASYDEELKQLSCMWSSPSDASKFITWESEEFVIEECINESAPDDPASWREVLVVDEVDGGPLEKDEFEDDPLIIGEENND